MRVMLVSQSDAAGGAARACYRLHIALRDSVIDSRLMVRFKHTDDWSVLETPSRIIKILNIFRPLVGSLIDRLQCGRGYNVRSGNWVPSRWSKRLNIPSVDLVNLHWVGAETLSLRDLGNIKKPIVWTVHDMWPFCGAEHLASEDQDERWRKGYSPINRPDTVRGMDLDRWVWKRKKKFFPNDIQLVAPSQWMAQCLSDSKMFSGFSVTVVPNIVNLNIYKPLASSFCRDVYNLPHAKKIILFGAVGGAKDHNKGFDLLIQALDCLAENISPDEVECVVLGQREPESPPLIPFKVHWLGHLSDDAALALAYNSADVVVVPSRLENLPQVATEAQSCGRAVVAFNCGGLEDAVSHMSTGYLATPYDATDLAQGIKLLLSDEDLRVTFGEAARSRAVALWSTERIVSMYAKIYQRAIGLRQE